MKPSLSNFPAPNTAASAQRIMGWIFAVHQIRQENRLRRETETYSSVRHAHAALAECNAPCSLKLAALDGLDQPAPLARYNVCPHPGCGAAIQRNARYCARHNPGHNRSTSGPKPPRKCEVCGVEICETAKRCNAHRNKRAFPKPA